MSAVIEHDATETPIVAPSPDAEPSPTVVPDDVVHPIGEVGRMTAAVCRVRGCHAGPHAERDGICARGHLLPGNRVAVLTGAHSAGFWSKHEEECEEIQDAVIKDAGHDPRKPLDVPKSLAIAAESIAQCVLVRDSAYLRLAAEGGPLSSSGRARRGFTVWASAIDRLERHLRLVGLRRVPPPPESLSAYLARSSQSLPPLDETVLDASDRANAPELPPTPTKEQE